MIKILFFIDSIAGGGAEKVLRNLVNNMDQDKFDITIQTIDHAPAEKYLRKEVRYKSINRFRNPLLKKMYQYWIRLCAELKILYPLYIKDDYDIEVAYLECGPTKIIASSTNKKAVKIAWVHCDLEKKEGFTNSIEKSKKYYEKYDKIVCVSKEVQLGFQKLFGTKFKTIVENNVIDEEEVLNGAAKQIEWDFKNGQKRLLAVGRLVKQKNFTYLIDTCAKLKDADFSFQLIILGEGPERHKLEKQINELNIWDCIKLQGFCANPYPYMREADIIICSSLYEGISTVVQEALILGKPIVTTPCTGMEELLGESEYGVIAENTQDGLYKALVRLFNSEELLDQYRYKAAIRGKFYWKKRIVHQTEQILINLVHEKTAGGNR